MRWVLPIALLLLMVGCDDGYDNNDANDSGADGDTDADTDTGPCEPTATWGSGPSIFVDWYVANWQMNGLFDGDKDGEIDETTADFDLEDIFCMGYDSAVVLVSDANCNPCTQRYGDLSANGFMDSVDQAGGALLMFYSGGLGASTKTAEECHDYFSEHYGFDKGFYVNGPPNYIFDFPFFPFITVIDLHSGKSLNKDVEGDMMTMNEILDLVGQCQPE